MNTKSARLFLAAIIMTAAVTHVRAAVRYVNVNSASPSSPYTNWTTAAVTIQDAIDVAADGDEVVVTNGVYQTGGRVVDGAITDRVAVTKPLTVRSVNGPEVTVIRGNGARCAYLTNGATLVGFTLTNGYADNGGGLWCASASAIVSNCVLSGNSAYDGGGVYGGTLNNCTLTGNSAYYGGGAISCILNNCALTGNSARGYGGGAAYCTLNNCVVTGNSAPGRDQDHPGSGGGAAFSTLNNCTVAFNSVGDDGDGGGAYGGTLNNCIVYYNDGGNYASDPRVWYFESITLNYCATTPLPIKGTGNITNEPVFVAWDDEEDEIDLHLAWNSPCINAGNNAYAPNGFDLDGRPRIVGATVDIGAYELQEPYTVGATVTEGNAGTTNAVFSVHLATNHSEMVSIDFTTVDGSATAGSDYLATSGTLVFNPGETNKPITVPVLGDILDEADETFFVRLSNPTNISLVNTQAVGTILNDDTVPLSIAGVTVIEGNTGTTNAVFTLHLDRPHVLPVSVAFGTADGSAVASADYIATNGTVTFAPGETNKSITVLVNGDLVDETHEAFFVNLSNPLHAVLTSVQATGTILDDDTVPLSITGTAVFEGNAGTTNAIFTFYLTRPHVLPVSVDFATADGSAVAGSDYIATSGTVIFAPGETNKNITVLVIGDLLHERDETFVVNLSAQVHATLAATRASGTILNNDTVRLYVNLNSPSPVPPYASSATAATTIQDAIDAALDGDEIVVTNGVYSTGGRAVFGTMTNRVAVTKRLILRSVNGPGVTVIQGHQVPVSLIGDGAVRCVYLTNGAALIGFTVANGATLQDFSLRLGSGGGIWCESVSALVSNCVLTGNSAYYSGGGTVSGTLNNCTITGNLASSYQGGGGALGSALNNCTLSGNSAGYGGGAAGGTLNNCTLTGNDAKYSGGGAHSCTLNNCALIGNSQSFSACGDDGCPNFGGGGAAYSTLKNCTLTGNTDNAAFRCTLNNCIVYYNGPVFFGSVNNHYESSLNNSCTTPLPPGGVGNFTNAPLFVDQVRLQPNSPCINAGNNTYAPAGLDLGGTPRIVGSTVDVGAYEFQSPQSLISYAWLQQYGLPINPATASADPDGDRLNNYQEWRAGTDPTNALSVLRLLAPVSGAPGVIVSWRSVNSRNYYLERGTNLGTPPPFLLLKSNIVGQAGTTTFTDTNAVGAGPFFYRVGVQE